MKRRFVSFFLILTVVFALNSCKSTDPSGGNVQQGDSATSNESADVVTVQPEENPLVICTSEWDKNDVQELIKIWKRLYPGVSTELVTIPKGEDQAEIAIDSLKTEIMAGQGPDVFILRTKIPGDESSYTALFDDPQKVIHNGTFLNLDAYISRAKNIDLDRYQTEVVNAGKMSNGQYILPYAYTYPICEFETSQLNGEKLPVTWEELMEADPAGICKNISMSIFYSNVFADILDYDNNTIVITEEQIRDSVKKLAEFFEQSDEDTVSFQRVEFMEGTIAYDSSSGEEHTYFTIPNTEDGMTVGITLYAAINSHTKQPENAFSFIDLMYNPEIMHGEGMEIDGEIYADTMGWSMNSILVDHGALCQDSNEVSEQDKAKLQEIYDRINCARFYTGMDDDLIDMAATILGYYRQDEAKRNALVAETYNTLWMKSGE